MASKSLHLNPSLRILVTGGAGFIGSNLCESLLANGNSVICLDNFATGHRKNIEGFLDNERFTCIEGDIRSIEDCRKACDSADAVLHQAALGSVPRSIDDPITTNAVNISGLLNMLVAVKEAGIKRFVYAASSSTYGDSVKLPKVEAEIGKPMSPYAITKYVNELYAENFSKLFGIETIGLRYFNVFGKRQDPNGAYAAVIPKFVSLLIRHQSPVINGDGSYSRDFTYVDNVVQANLKSLIVQDPKALNTVYNVAYGERTDLNALFALLKDYLSKFDPKISKIEPIYGPGRAGDVPHSLASIEKARGLLGYDPQFSPKEGLREAIDWYWNNLK